jgi:ligand-binding sensor domain-containing protein
MHRLVEKILPKEYFKGFNYSTLTCTFTIVSILNKIIAQIFFLLITTVVNSQTTERIRFNLFNNTNGLSKQIIKGITEDRNGFIWLLSDHQLQWFDGSSFHQVPFGTGIHQLPGSLFSEIHQGVDKDIWIFYNNGYSIYDPKTFTFKHS